MASEWFSVCDEGEFGRAVEVPVIGHPDAADYVLREWVAPIDWLAVGAFDLVLTTGIVRVLPMFEAVPKVGLWVADAQLGTPGHFLTPAEAEALGHALISAAAESRRRAGVTDVG